MLLRVVFEKPATHKLAEVSVSIVGKKEKKKKTKLLLTGLRRHNCSVKKNTASCDLSAITKSFASKYKTGLDDSSKLKLLVRGLLNY